MNQSLSFNLNTAIVISRYYVGLTPANAGETAILDILLTADASGFLYGDLSEHGGDIATIDSTTIQHIVSGLSVDIVVTRRAAALLIKINNSPSLSDIISFGFINSTHIRRSIPVSNISLRNIADEFTQPNVNSKIRLYGGGESGLSASATGVQRSFSEFANKEYKIIKYAANTSGGANVATIFTETELSKINSKKLIANSYITIGNLPYANAITATVSWSGNVDIVNYGKIKAGSDASAIFSDSGSSIQVVNLGIIRSGGGAGGRGGYGGNGINSGGITLGGAPGVGTNGAGYLTPIINRNSGTIGTNGGGTGGPGGHGGAYGQAGETGFVGTDGFDSVNSVSVPAPTTGIFGPFSGNAAPKAVGGNPALRYISDGSTVGGLTGLIGEPGGVGEILSITPPTQYIIPVDSIIVVNSGDPNYWDWEYYAPADDNFIIGTATQSEIGTEVAAAGSTTVSIDSLGTSGAHVGTPYYSSTGAYWTTYAFNGGAAAGDHTHTIIPQTPVGTEDLRPYQLKRALLRAKTDQTEFPPNTVHINQTKGDANWTSIFSGSASIYPYINGSSTFANIDKTSLTARAYTNTLSASTHNHRGTATTYPTSNQIYGSSQRAAGANESGYHSHLGLSATATANTLKGKLIAMWADATEGIPYTDDIIMYCGDLSLLPSYWKVCDGNNGTVDMQKYFLGYNYVAGSITTTGYAWTTSTGTTTSPVSFEHVHHTTFSTFNYLAGSLGHGYYTYSHSHTINSTATSNRIPAHIKLAFIQFKP